jgi:hypothetical protein
MEQAAAEEGSGCEEAYVMLPDMTTHETIQRPTRWHRLIHEKTPVVFREQQPALVSETLRAVLELLALADH